MDIRRERCYQSLVDLLGERMHERDEHVRSLLAAKRRKDIKQRASEQREALRRMLHREYENENTPAEHVRSVPMDGYSIDCYIIPGASGCDIPVNLYIPPRIGNGKFPAVIVPVGHWPEGKAEINVRRLCAGFALRGIIAATYDPVNQGERCPVDTDAYLRMRPGLREDMLPVAMHMLPGNLFYMLGENLGSLFAWEAMRVCDLLCGLDMVDGTRIGVTGQSGGGTQSLFLAALDDRIMACSPVQCLTKLAGILRDVGIGDCEQSILGMCGDDRFDYADFLWAVFPKHLMINAARGDYFSLDGVLTLYDEIEKLYGYSDSVCQLRISDGGHIMCPQSRRFALDFFSEVFKTPPLGGPDDSGDLDALDDLGDLGDLSDSGDSGDSGGPGDLVDSNVSGRQGELSGQNSATRTAGRRLKAETKEPPIPDAGDIACMTQKPPSATAVARQILEAGLRARPMKAEDTLKRVTALLQIKPFPPAVFREEESDGFSLKAGHACIRGIYRRGTPDTGLMLLLGPVREAEMPKVYEGSYVLADPMCMKTAEEKREHGYDAETRLFNIGAIMSLAPAATRCELVRLLLDELEKRGWDTRRTTIAADGAAGIQALYIAAYDPRITKVILRGAPDSMDACFYYESIIIPETFILPGLAEVCDLDRLADIVPASVTRT